MKINSLFVVSLLIASNAMAMDLSQPFICPDISPTPMRIVENGLMMNGVVYPLKNPNSSWSPLITNTIFGSRDGLEEIDVMQHGNGKVDVSYMKYRFNPYESEVNPDKAKAFEKASYSIEDPPAYFFSKGQGCQN
jgi:hypothetical protein